MLHALSALRTAVAALTLSGLAFAGGDKWFADFDLAQKEAQKSGKDLLVDFTGSDWCGWCIRLHQEVFEHEAFDQGVQKDFVLVALDFPQAKEVKAKVPNPKRNEELQRQHGVNSFPTILLMTAQGEVYGRTGYKKGGPEAYVAHLGELRQTGKQQLADIAARVAAFDAASGEAKGAAWDQLAALAESMPADSAFLARLVVPLEAAFQLDPANQQGRKLRAAKLLLTIGKDTPATLAAARELDPKNEHGLLELTVAVQFGQVQDEAGVRAAIAALTAFESTSKFKDADLGVTLCGTAAKWLAEFLGEPEEAKPWARKALAYEPEDPNLRAMLEQLAGD